jgi:hypothetical protein
VTSALEAHLEVARRRAQAYEMRRAGVDLAVIAQTLGYPDSASVWKDVKIGLERAISQAVEDLDGMRGLEIARLEDLRRRAVEVMDAARPVPREDEDAPKGMDGSLVLAAIDRTIKIAERLARLKGLDAPTRVGVSGTVRYELPGVDPDMLT